MKCLTDDIILEKIQKEKCYLLGQVSLNPEEEEGILDYAQKVLNNKDINEYPNLVLSLALVLVAITDYQDGKYWESLKNRLKIEDWNQGKQQKIGRMFINTINKYELFELNQSTDKSMRFVENIKAHAFVTNNYMDGFYDFLTDYYDNNLLRDISDGVEETLQDLSEFIKSTLNQKDDIVYSGSGKAAKSYRLLKSTREVIANCDGGLLFQFLYPLLEIIDKNFYDGIIPNENNGRFAKGFVSWNKKNLDKLNENKERNSQRRLYSKKAYLIMKPEDNYFMLVIPKQRFRNNECEGIVEAEIIVNGISQKINLEVYKSMGTYITEEKRVAIEYPFDEIYIKFKALVYRETTIPEKDYVIFTEDYIRKDKLEKGTNYILVKKECDFRVSDESMIIEKIEYEEWDTYKLNIDDNSIIYVGGKPITIIGEFNNIPVFENEIDTIKIYDKDNRIITATHEHPKLFIEISKEKEIGTTIQINKRNYSLNDKHIHVYESPYNKNNLIIASDLKDFIENEDGNYKIELNIIGEPNKCIAEYLLLNRMKIFFDKKRYSSENIGELAVKIGNFSVDILSEECSLKHQNENFGNYYYEVDLSTGLEEIKATIKVNEEEYFTKFEIPRIKYGFDINNLKYKSEKVEKIWHGDLKGLLYIKYPGAIKIAAFLDDDKNTICWGERDKNGIFKIDINKLIELSKSINSSTNKLVLKYIDNRERTSLFFIIEKSIYVNPYFIFEEYNGNICFNTKFVERPNVKIYFDIQDAITKKIIINHKELVNGINQLTELKKDNLYNIFPYIEETDEFGLETKTTKMSSRLKKGLINNILINKDIVELAGNQFFIDCILLNGEKINLNYLYAYKIEIQEKIGHDEFQGNLYEYSIKDHYSNNVAKNNRINIGKVKIKCEHSDNENIYYNITLLVEIGYSTIPMKVLYKKDIKRLTGYSNFNKENEDKYIELNENSIFITKKKE